MKEKKERIILGWQYGWCYFVQDGKVFREYMDGKTEEVSEKDLNYPFKKAYKKLKGGKK